METKTIRSIVIDPIAKSIYEDFFTIDISGADAGWGKVYDHARNLIGCRIVTSDPLGGGVMAFFDDEGILTDWDTQGFFKGAWYPAPLAGRYLLICSVDDEEGNDLPESLHPAITVKYMWGIVEWMDAKDVVVPAPSMTTLDDDGNEHTESLGGDKNGNWTYQDQP